MQACLAIYAMLFLNHALQEYRCSTVCFYIQFLNNVNGKQCYLYMSKYNLKFFYPNYFSYKLIAYVCLSLAEHMKSAGFETTVMGIASYKDARVPLYKDAIPPLLKNIAYRLFDDAILSRFAEYRFKRSVVEGDIVYLWPGSSVTLFENLKKKGCIVVRENINTHTAYAKKLLDAEYNYLGIKSDNTISKGLIEKETEIQKYTDLVFSPSPLVTQSLLKFGVPSDSILQTSYGLRKSEILDNVVRSYEDDDYITVIFVGSICVRKGVHLLLDTWEKANINGRLILVGSMGNNIKELVSSHLSENILHIPHVDNLKAIYANADIFILPSLEEGSPLVTYLALGAGLPSIVSPMGGGGIINDTEGFVIDPHDQTAWVNAIKTLASNGKLRQSMGENALRKSKEYTWDNVGKKRAQLLEEKLRLLNI